MSEYCKNCYELTEKLEKQKDYIINYKLFSMDKYDQLKAENEKLKKDRINIIKENSKDYRKLQQAEQKLERIEKYCEEQNLKADYTACEILQIIDEEA